MNSKFNRIISLLSKELRVFLGITLSLFLFMLFFQPFPIEYFNFSDNLLVIAGFEVILFLVMVTVRVILFRFIQNFTRSNQKAVLPYYAGNISILVLSSVGCTFYLHYVGFVPVSFYMVIKVIIICFSAPVALWLSDTYAALKQQNAQLLKEKMFLQEQIKEINDDAMTKNIELVSENNADNLNLPVSSIVYVKSADNYVEVAYENENKLNKKLVRNTLKNIELQFKSYPAFIRCHRMYIVNVGYIVKLEKSNGNHSLIIKGSNDLLPVSRQYLLMLRERVSH